jgi:hypothetical protein
MIFPLAYLALTSALSVLLIAAGLAGQAALAAEMAVIQGALLATFYAFSANTRSLILQGHGDLTPARLLGKRVLALPLLGAAAYLLCVAAAGVSPLLAALLIARRACEWLAEVRLCEIEVAGERRAARRALAVQAVVTLATAAVLAFAPAAALPALAVFAISPLLPSLPRPSLAAFRPATLRATLRGATPHIGSTAIEGISTYVLRLVVFLIAGREVAGLLFTAFVLGSFVATLFANVLGPSLALQRARNGGGGAARLVVAAPLALAAAGLILTAASLATRLVDGLGKPGYFWLALGLSLLGGAVMIAAQRIRLRLFDERRGEVLFGPDVLRTLSAIIAAPTLYFLVAPAALGGLYLATALLTLFFYWGAASHAVHELPAAGSAALRMAIAAALLLPLFFMLSGRIYRNPGPPLLDAGGGLMNVPLPLSLAACFAGILLLARYRHAGLALGTIFFLFVAMVLTSVVVSDGDIAYESRKFLLLFQFLVPVFALVLGQMFGAPQQGLRLAALAFGAVLALIVPWQLLRSVGYAETELYHDLGLFSIYQHLQYVPSVFVCAYLVAVFALWQSPRRRLIVITAPLMGLYVTLAYSTLSIALLAGGVLVFAALRRREAAARWVAVLVFAAGGLGLFLSQNTTHAWQKFRSSAEATDWRLSRGPATDVPRHVLDAVPAPAQVRLHYWQLFGRGIIESPRSALFGHAQAIDRSVAASAHNYYLDFVYNFGLLAFLPLAWLIAQTLHLLWRLRGEVWRDLPLIGLAIAVLFALGLDSNFKVPLRQPYPGIFFFFLWGLLIARLRALRAEAR